MLPPHPPPQVIDSALRMLHELPRPLTSKQLCTKYMQQGEALLSVYNTALAEPHFQALRAACIDHVQTSYAQVCMWVGGWVWWWWWWTSRR